MSSFAVYVGATVTLDRNGIRQDFRVDAVDTKGRTFEASYRITDPELIHCLGAWDA